MKIVLDCNCTISNVSMSFTVSLFHDDDDDGIYEYAYFSV